MAYDKPLWRSQSAGGAYTFATLPSASVMIGEAQGIEAYTSDAGLCIWNGSSWAPSYGTQSGTSATLYVSATGSDSNQGTSWAQAFATIQAAINALPANGGTVEVGYGQFSGFSITNAAQQQIRVRGRGIGGYGTSVGVAYTSVLSDATAIVNSVANTSAITVTGVSSVTNNDLYFRLEDIAVVGTASTAVTFTAPPSGATSTLTASLTNATYTFILSTNQALTGTVTGGTTVTWTPGGIQGSPTVNASYITTLDGITLTNTNHIILKNVATKFNGRHGIYVTTTYWLYFDSVHAIANAQHGFTNTGNMNLTLVSNGVFNGNGLSGAAPTAGNQTTFLSTDFSFNGTYGSNPSNGSPYNYIGCWFEKNGGPGVHNSATGAVYNIAYCNFTGDGFASSNYGIQSLGSTDIYNIIGNKFANHQISSIDNGQGSAGVISQNLSSDSFFLFRYNGSQSNLGSAAHVAGSLAQGTFNNQTINAQTLGANGAVTFDASKSVYSYGFQNIVLSANATSSSITNAIQGQTMTIQWQQDGTGSRTYVWPTNCKFNANTQPVASTTAGLIDSVTFTYDGTNWAEVGRAIGVPS